MTQAFYDSLGRNVEILSPGPDATHSVFQSLPFRVASRTTWLDPNGATDDTGSIPGGTTTVLDALNTPMSTTDPLSNQSTATYGLGTTSGDTATYALTTNVDANHHVQLTYTDAIGRTRYMLGESGTNGGTLTPVSKQTTQYNALDKATSVQVTDLVPQSGQAGTSVTTTALYDDLGRMTSLNDPDRGTHTYTYDADDQTLTDISGTRTIGTSYDLLGRTGCIQDASPSIDGSGTCSSGSHPLVQNSYDSSVLGTAGTSDFSVGALTQSVANTYYDPADFTNKTTVTEQYQHNKRGQLVTSTIQVGVPSSWGVTTALPTYQQTQAYNSADQETTTQTIMGTTAGYAFSNAYDSTTGLLMGLSNNSTASANMATQGYNVHGLVSDINFQTTTGTQLATEHFDQDGNLRPAATTATWQSGSGSSGTIFSQGLAYDAVGNVISASLTHATVPGQTGSGGSETQNFCYDEQNQLLWAGNAGTQPAAGTGSCGSGTLANSISGAGYSNTLSYTHLGQLWQGPLNGSGTSLQYLYCSSSHPHQLTGLYPTGTTCSSLSGASYSASYDAWGNMTSRTTGGSTAVLSYDILDHLVTWNAGSTSQEWYAYDASGNRILRRSTTSSGTSITTYPFGLEEHVYSSTGSNTNNTFYYLLDDRLIGEATGTTSLNTQFFLTDALGSVLTAFSASAGSAAVLGNQLYGPYGNQRYSKGTMGTAKGYTGQYGDITGLDYYNARYYDPVVGRFLSADTVQDNANGFDPYAYVLGNPETKNDPTGHFSFGLPLFISKLIKIVKIVIIVATGAAWVIGQIIQASKNAGQYFNQAKNNKSSSGSGSAKGAPTPTVAPSTDNAGSRCFRDPNCRDLGNSENAGGHALRDHVEIADPQAAADKSGKAISKFLRQGIAQNAVTNVLTRATKGLQPVWSKGYWVYSDIDVGFQVGFIYRRGQTPFVTSQITIVISSITDSIFTAYPSHKTIQNDYRP